MFKQKVVVTDPNEPFFGQTGIVVAISIGNCNLSVDNEESLCKVLIGNVISNWIPEKCLEIVRENSISA